ncbi:hypothetical protein [Halotia branconii]|uniref:Uncharacterized protein n=1 Tax=Halotia branconii CENA392 TaxID=1539056 RepID=A0AAJ6NVU3_9CYAN|nr:hypothetical protein [Halotia branconii]WGV27679.1 hypothetical protein QI031_09430 [Halotia branconii CENA392]
MQPLYLFNLPNKIKLFMQHCDQNSMDLYLKYGENILRMLRDRKLKAIAQFVL